MKLLVLGAGGQVGHELCRLAWPDGYSVAAFDRSGVDIAQREPVFAAVARERPDIVVNAAAYTAVDRAESEPDIAWASNCSGPANLAAACHDALTPLIHLSTDYVFDGSKAGAWREEDPVKPLGVYGKSKEAGDQAVRGALAHHVILRTAWVYSAHGRNFVKTMLRLAGERPVLRVLADQRRRHRSRDRCHRATAQCREQKLGHLPLRRRRGGNLARFRRGDLRAGRATARPAAAGRGDRHRRLPNPGAASGQFGARLPPDRRGLRHRAPAVARGARRGDRRALSRLTD